MAILEGVRPLRMIPPAETASNSNNVFDSDPSKVVNPPDNSTSWLPPGWEVFSRIKSSGASYKVYRESETGRKFYSRVEVFKYLQSLTQQNPSPHTPQQKVQAEPITIPGKHPNWLPPDWVVEIKTKMSGRTAGHRYKVYVEKSTGRKFYSQREALDYLKPSNSSTPGMKNVLSATSEDHPQWLPSGWSVQTETEGGSSTSERKDKVFVEPITGMKFYTHKEVFDHLNNLNSSTENKKNAEPESNSGDQKDQIRDTEIGETDVKGLPPGWFKAFRYRETRAGIRRKTAVIMLFLLVKFSFLHKFHLYLRTSGRIINYGNLWFLFP
ncbi:Methyl-CpG-binding domain-containing protein 5 [Rhynchospora pubera]|uniref:Methyl-CpG-binding domain-containing protein 5 n=1 Tax=Rhynchospora pubera TaxID=906938 RepID=A0AAV8F164_9POAL|nr:Methyl-CpG-binding domain-containing protein 5 [Rhynchospora pubera]